MPFFSIRVTDNSIKGRQATPKHPDCIRFWCLSDRESSRHVHGKKRVFKGESERSFGAVFASGEDAMVDVHGKTAVHRPLNLTANAFGAL